MLLRKTFRFEASHVLPKHPGKCSRLHGHSWVLHVEVNGTINANSGFVMDYAEITKWVNPIVESLDHRHLGAWTIYARDRHPTGDSSLLCEIWGADECGNYFDDWFVPNLPTDFNPTSENLLHWIGYQLISFPWSKLALEETCTSYAELTREEFNAISHQS